MFGEAFIIQNPPPLGMVSNFLIMKASLYSKNIYPWKGKISLKIKSYTNNFLNG